MRYTIFDLEADGLLNTLTKLHCLCASIFEDGVLIFSVELTNIEEIIIFLDQQDRLVGHNIIMYDLPVLKKLYGYTFKGEVFDTLPISWYLYPNKKEHGLDMWGKELGILKPAIEDWTGLSLEAYIYRCSEDVKINALLFQHFLQYLDTLYAEKSITSIIRYLSWKMACAQEQVENPLTIDRNSCRLNLDKLNILVEEKKVQLALTMPKEIKYKTISKPSKMYKIDGNLSSAGVKWLAELADNDLEADFDGQIQKIASIKEPNPTSVVQLKKWLFELGWQPTVFKHVANKAGVVRPIPQLQTDDKKLCPNILVLIDRYPELEALKGLFMLQHRVGVFEGFLECADENGKMVAEIAGLTNTLRFRHKKPIANLPGVFKPYGKEIRGAIIAPDEDHLFCGSDMVAIEDSTKQHYMYFYDPQYVTEMRTPGFDPHISIAILAGLLTFEEGEEFKFLDKLDEKTSEQQIKYAKYKKARSLAKTVNFGCVYGAGPPKIALTTGMPLSQARLLHTTYWQRNKAVKLIAADCLVKTVRNQMWLYNPVSNFWYSLRADKDRFSTLNQGTAVFCFDTQVRNVRRQGIAISLQYHDELGFPFLKKDEDDIRRKLNNAIKETNDMLRLNVPMGISIDISSNYAEAH